jgi:Flp pilus assembly protein TadD
LAENDAGDSQAGKSTDRGRGTAARSEVRGRRVAKGKDSHTVRRDGLRWADLSGKRWLLLGGVALVSGLVYAAGLNNQFVFDDHEMVVANRFIGQWSFLWKSLINDSWWFRDPAHLPQSSYYRPLQDIWLALNYHLFGLAPFGWHLTMVLLHVLVVLLVFRVAERLAQSYWAALTTALLFGLLPIHAEAVIWPAAIPEPLAAAFELAAFNSYLARRTRPGSWNRRQIGSATWFALALLSHESAITFPLLVIGYRFCFGAPGTGGEEETGEPPCAESTGSAARVPSLRRLIDGLAEAVPYLAVAAVYLVLRFAVLGFITRRNPGNHLSVAAAIAVLPSVAAAYLALLLAPWAAGPSHRLAAVPSVGSPLFLLPTAAVVLLLLAAWSIISRTRRASLYYFCLLWIAITLAPIFNIRALFAQALVQDRYLYLPSFGWCLIVGDVVVRAAQQPRRAGLVTTATALLAASYAVALWRVQRFWHDEVALFTECVARYPGSAIYHNRLGLALEARGDLDGAVAELGSSLKLDPTDGATEYDLGLVHLRMGDTAKGATELRNGLARLPDAPASAWIDLARVQDSLGDESAREAALASASRTPGGLAAVALFRAQAAVERGDGAAAETLLRPALAEHPDDPRILTAMGSAMATQQRYAEAMNTSGARSRCRLKTRQRGIWPRSRFTRWGRIARPSPNAGPHSNFPAAIGESGN